MVAIALDDGRWWSAKGASALFCPASLMLSTRSGGRLRPTASTFWMWQVFIHTTLLGINLMWRRGWSG